MKRSRRVRDEEEEEETKDEAPPNQRTREGEQTGRGRGAVTADRASYFARGDTSGVTITPAPPPKEKEQWPGMFHTAANLRDGRSAAQAKRQEDLEKKAATHEEEEAVSPWEPRPKKYLHFVTWLVLRLQITYTTFKTNAKNF
ncbi:unnamed protein product [Aphanomyces euteiches]